MFVLQPGESRDVPAGTLVLKQGELLVREPAVWLADSVVVPPARHISGPASVELEGGHSVTALADAEVVFEQHRNALAEAIATAASVLRRRFTAPSYRAA